MSTYLAVGLLVGVFLALVYAFEAHRRKVGPSLDKALPIVVSAVGIAIGGRVVYICLSSSDLGPFSGEDSVYICIGGLALMWVSIDQVRNGIFGPKREHDAKKAAATKTASTEGAKANSQATAAEAEA